MLTLKRESCCARVFEQIISYHVNKYDWSKIATAISSATHPHGKPQHTAMELPSSQKKALIILIVFLFAGVTTYAVYEGFFREGKASDVEENGASKAPPPDGSTAEKIDANKDKQPAAPSTPTTATAATVSATAIPAPAPGNPEIKAAEQSNSPAPEPGPSPVVSGQVKNDPNGKDVSSATETGTEKKKSGFWGSTMNKIRSALPFLKSGGKNETEQSTNPTVNPDANPKQ